jgi:hypothetical protein
MSVVPFPSDRRRALRRAWLGAAATATLGGAGLADVAGIASAYAAESGRLCEVAGAHAAVS